jgi:hypothetical protein
MFQPYCREATPHRHDILCVRIMSSLSKMQPKFVLLFASNLHALSNENDKNIYLSIWLSVCLSIFLSIYLFMALQPFVSSWPLFQFIDLFTQPVGHFGREISPSQGRYLHTGQHRHRINSHRHPCLKWDSNLWSQRSSERRYFMP